MKLYEILKGSEYSLELFSQDAIVKLENRIIERTDKKGKTYPAVSCLIRNKEIKLTPEEIVRQLYTAKLMTDYGYPKVDWLLNILFISDAKPNVLTS